MDAGCNALYTHGNIPLEGQIGQLRFEEGLVLIQPLLAFEDAQSKFSAERGGLAEQIDDLVTGGFLEGVPADPFGLPYILDKDGKASVAKRKPIERKER